jgi:ornithine cyclodeaminase
MVAALFGGRLRKARIYDVRPVTVGPVDLLAPDQIEVVPRWQDAYDPADVFITCTVAEAPYIDRRPKPGSLQLNVSLRDYTTAVFGDVKGAIIVDDWEEVCREGTDIEVFHQREGLQKADVKTLVDVVDGAVSGYPAGQAVMFNPMGMGVFDVAIAAHFHQKATRLGVGTTLE